MYISLKYVNAPVSLIPVVFYTLVSTVSNISNSIPFTDCTLRKLQLASLVQLSLWVSRVNILLYIAFFVVNTFFLQFAYDIPSAFINLFNLVPAYLLLSLITQFISQTSETIVIIMTESSTDNLYSLFHRLEVRSSFPYRSLLVSDYLFSLIPIPCMLIFMLICLAD